MTTFKTCLEICGLSNQAAADFLDVRLDTVKSWCAERNRPPAGVWEMLADLFEQIQDAADGAADVMAENGIDPRSYGSIDADLSKNPLPVEGAVRMAGAMALLMAIRDSRG